MIAVRAGQYSIVLESAKNDAGSDTKFISKAADCSAASAIQPPELSVFGLWNQPFPCKRISLKFLLVLGSILCFNDNSPFAMKQNVRSFVEEGEPQMIIGLVTEAQLNQRNRLRQPSGRSPSASFWQLWYKNKLNARLAAFRHNDGPKIVGQVPCQSTDACQH